MFSLSSKKVSASDMNSVEGYKLTITYKPTAVGTHSTTLFLYDGGFSGSKKVAIIEGTCLDAPTLSVPLALEAENVTAEGYRAVWQPVAEQIDYYIVTRSIYKNGSLINTEYVDTEDTYYDFTRESGTYETYCVQSSRLGYVSEKSNIITVSDYSGVQGVHSDKILAVAQGDDCVRFICTEPLSDVRVYNMQGVMIKEFRQVENDFAITLPIGIYVISAKDVRRPVKVVVR